MAGEIGNKLLRLGDFLSFFFKLGETHTSQCFHSLFCPSLSADKMTEMSY